VPFARFSSVLALAALGVSCHNGPPPAIDPAAAACVPPGAVILAGVNLDRLRASPLDRELPPAAAVFLEPLRNAASLLLASDGSDYLAVSRGPFLQAPAGATLLAPGLAAAGSPGWLRAATARRRSGATGATALLERAEPLAAASEIWVVASGKASFPVSGNGENLNRLLHATEYATLSVRLANGITLEATGVCADADAARHLEETVRAMVTLGAAASARQTAIASLLKRIRTSRDARAVHLNLLAQPADLEQLLKLL
jgi:hypothetical protein